MARAQVKSSVAKPHKLSLITKDRGYRFTDRDPDLEFVCNAITASQLTTAQLSSAVNKISSGAANVHSTTIDYWLSGRTRRPQNFTITWVMQALGYKRNWISYAIVST